MIDDATKTELAALKARIEELERKGKPPAPFKEEPYQRYDPTAGMTMPPSALQAMIAAEPRGFMKRVVADNRAPTGRPGMIPEQPSNARGTNVAGSGTGWAHDVPLSNPPGVAQADKLMDEQDRRDRAELAQKLGALKR
jgi:hypothetical protein